MRQGEANAAELAVADCRPSVCQHKQGPWSGVPTSYKSCASAQAGGLCLQRPRHHATMDSQRIWHADW
jgi:hypothetical protein